MSDKSNFKALAEDYPQLYLDPDKDTQDTYKDVVLRGEMPAEKSLDHYTGDEADRCITADTPAGTVLVVTVGNRKDFELIVRGLMAAKNGPLAEVPASQGAAMFTVFNWPRINRHLEDFPEEERSAEFKRFTSVKENYIDMLVVLSRGPYSNVDAGSAGCSEDEWIELSDTIRRFHELTHVICRRMYPGDIDAIRDELVADAVGLYAAFGYFDVRLEKLFLGITDKEYTGGRLENYTDEPDKIAAKVCDALGRIEKVVNMKKWEEPFDLIPELMKTGQTIMQKAALKQLSVNMGKPEYDMLQGISAVENGFTNPAYNLSYDEYKEWLRITDNNSIGKDLPEGWIPFTTYFLYIDDIPVGYGRVRHSSSEYLETVVGAGNLGYGIAKEYRGKGYGGILFEELLKKCKEIGYKEIKLFPMKSNTPSVNIMLKNGGQIIGDFKDLKYIIRIPLD